MVSGAPGAGQTPKIVHFRVREVVFKVGFRDYVILAALRADMNIKSKYPPDPGRNRPKTNDFLRNMSVRTLPPPGPPVGVGAKNKIKHVLGLGGGPGIILK